MKPATDFIFERHMLYLIYTKLKFGMRESLQVPYISEFEIQLYCMATTTNNDCKHEL